MERGNEVSEGELLADLSVVHSSTFSLRCCFTKRVSSGEMAYDASRRLYVGNLPPDTTKHDIIDLIRKRSRANPQHIDIAIDADGKPRGFAHCSVEGLRNVIEAINGMPLKNNRVVAAAAHTHFSVAITNAKRERERADRAAIEARETAEEEAKAKREAFVASGEKVVLKAPLSFYGGRQHYAKIASKVAATLRTQFINATGGTKPFFVQRRVAQRNDVVDGQTGNLPSAEPATNKQHELSAEGKSCGAPNRKRQRLETRQQPSSQSGATKKATQQPAIAAPPPPPPQPTKEERKVAGLQARLAMLRQKLGSK